ncbi:MaoC family dehydratase [Niveispirillum sp.]|uniref:MaoC family dehydratase n=1 Tax=Niveispirillum sp. TaxID=1917217 RepID=UPI001B3FF407|nr:MaoC family dehydratase [Niveispirillum sp.]MBP7335714.1 MaoC family dehydratase [Niveispirillum sp.]
MSGILAILQAEIGVMRRSDWLAVDQPMIDRFAEATFDHQFIHVDPVRAAATPFGGTVAHGFLTLSLLSRMAETTVSTPVPGIRMGVNYGFDRVRFVNPVRPGNRIRAASTLLAVEEKHPGQFQQRCNIVVEIEGADRPALVATWLNQLFV